MSWELFQIPSSSNVPPRHEFVLITIVIIVDMDQTLTMCQVYTKYFMSGFSQLDIIAATSSTYYYYLNFIKEDTKR